MTREELAAIYPSWSIWRGSCGDKPGDWHATRRAHRITPREINAGVYMTVDARTLDELADVLDDQAAKLGTVRP
ncbi:hypothetical protein ACQP2T_40530 [Nonomuraea sp. CA-143628]|uniref:hypothetical protein n=1 Tax=Nonomuraea sp. CA-143628 TaxID=3239997 RepID=UPI003D929515